MATRLIARSPAGLREAGPIVGIPSRGALVGSVASIAVS